MMRECGYATFSKGRKQKSNKSCGPRTHLTKDQESSQHPAVFNFCLAGRVMQHVVSDILLYLLSPGPYKTPTFKNKYQTIHIPRNTSSKLPFNVMPVFYQALLPFLLFEKLLIVFYALCVGNKKEIRYRSGDESAGL